MKISPNIFYWDGEYPTLYGEIFNSVNPMTKLVLTNAICFKGTWEWEFEESNTALMPFYVSSEKTVQTEMMHMEPEEAKFNYADLDDLQILELPYAEQHASMFILLPEEKLELSCQKLEEYKAHMSETKLN